MLTPNICDHLYAQKKLLRFYKRVKRMHDPAKIVVPCVVFEVEFPIPPDRSMHLGSYNEVFADDMYAIIDRHRPYTIDRN